MDSYRVNEESLEALAAESENSSEAVGSDERRMHVRAYNYWASLLHDRDLPSIEDLDPHSVTDFSANSVLLDFTAGRDDPSTPYIGAAILEECGLTGKVSRISKVPSRSLLSRLTDHYLQIIANRSPIGFEAEFINQRDQSISYRGILMPFSSDGDTIDFIYGVINWKDVGTVNVSKVDAKLVPNLAALAVEDEDPLELLLDEVLAPSASSASSASSAPSAAYPDPMALDALLPSVSMLALADREAGADLVKRKKSVQLGDPEVLAEPVVASVEQPLDKSVPAESLDNFEPAPLVPSEQSPDLAPEPVVETHLAHEEEPVPEPELGSELSLESMGELGLGDWLSAARESADICKQHDGRTRVALYRALALAYDFMIAARRVPDDYAELLADAGVRPQERAPMTPIVKLVFGSDYDKTRLTEFAAALSHGVRLDVDFGEFLSFVENYVGGLKGIVNAERLARRPASRPVLSDPRIALRQRSPVRLADLQTNQEFALVLTRRNRLGVLEIIGLVRNEKMVDQAMKVILDPNQPRAVVTDDD